MSEELNKEWIHDKICELAYGNWDDLWTVVESIWGKVEPIISQNDFLKVGMVAVGDNLGYLLRENGTLKKEKKKLEQDYTEVTNNFCNAREEWEKERVVLIKSLEEGSFYCTEYNSDPNKVRCAFQCAFCLDQIKELNNHERTNNKRMG